MSQKISNAKLVLLVALGVTIGLFANHLLTASSADAQTARPFSVCSGIRVGAHPRTVAIPRGWSVVGGGGGGSYVYAIACR